MKTTNLLLAGILATASIPAMAVEKQPVTVSIPRLSMEMALRAAQGAINACRRAGVQIAVTVVDRGGDPQVVLRDVLAMDVALPISRDKAYTAMSFNSATSALVGRFTEPGSIAKTPGLQMSAGGVPIVAGGAILGGIGVSGAPTGVDDEKCANAGLKAIMEELEMSFM
jgi:uncharacterized protein GlcG (DUF336 family)